MSVSLSKSESTTDITAETNHESTTEQKSETLDQSTSVVTPATNQESTTDTSSDNNVESTSVVTPATNQNQLLTLLQKRMLNLVLNLPLHLIQYILHYQPSTTLLVSPLTTHHM